MKKRYLAILLATSMVFASVSSVSAMYEFSDGTSAEISGAGEDVDNSTDDEPELFSDDLTSVDSGDDGLELEMGQSAEIGFSDDFAVEDGENVAAATSQSTYNVHVSGTVYLSEAEKFLELVNAERAKKGVEPMKLDNEMMRCAIDRAAQASIVYNHILPNDKQVRSKYPNIMTENISLKTKYSAETFFNSWMNSPAHKDALLTGNQDLLGFAVFKPEGSNWYGGAATFFYSNKTYSYTPFTGSYSDYSKDFEMEIANRYLDFKTDSPLSCEVGSFNTLIPKLKNYVYCPPYDIGTYNISSRDGIWESSNPSVASVDSNGNVTALKAGTASLKFYVNGSDRYYEKTVKVTGNTETATPTPIPTSTPIPTATPTEAPKPSVTPTETPKPSATPTPSESPTPTPTEAPKPTATPTPIPTVTLVPSDPDGKQDFTADIQVQANPDGEYVNISWNQVPNVDGYLIYKKYNNGYARMQTVYGNETSCRYRLGYDKDLTLIVRAYKTGTSGILYSSNSNEVTVKTSKDFAAPAAPVLTAKRKGTTVIFSWDQPENAEKYRIYVSADGKTYKSLKTVGDETTASGKFTLGQTLRFKIRAASVQGSTEKWSGYSKAVTVKMVPSKTAVKSISNKNRGKLTLSWKKVSEAKGYEIYRKIGKTGKYKKIKTVTKNSTVKYTNTKLKKGTAYYYRIRSYTIGADGKKVYSRWSNVKGKTCR